MRRGTRFPHPSASGPPALTVAPFFIPCVPVGRKTRLVEHGPTEEPEALPKRRGRRREAAFLGKGRPFSVLFRQKRGAGGGGDAGLAAAGLRAGCGHRVAAGWLGLGGCAHGGPAPALHGAAALWGGHAVALADGGLRAGEAAWGLGLRAGPRRHASAPPICFASCSRRAAWPPCTAAAAFCCRR